MRGVPTALIKHWSLRRIYLPLEIVCNLEPGIMVMAPIIVLFITALRNRKHIGCTCAG